MSAVVPQPGDFFVTEINGGVGFLIRVGQWLCGKGFRRFEHAAVYVGDGRIVEAEPGGAREADLAEYDGRPIAWSTGHIELTDAQRAAIVAAARASIGTPYSWLDYVALAARRFHIPVPGLRRYIAASGHQICSQAIDAEYLAAGVHLFSDGRWPGYVTPIDLADLIG